MYFQYEELLKSPIHRAAYSDRTAWIMAEMSALAYLHFEKNEKEFNSLKENLEKAKFELVEIFNSGETQAGEKEVTVHDEENLIKMFLSRGTQAFLAKDNERKVAVLAFRGTQTEGMTLETLIDGFVDLYAALYELDGEAKVHSGFYNAFQGVRERIAEKLENLRGYSVYITGHSLGGALALVATQEFNDNNNIAACYTFGSPKVGNEEYDDKVKVPIYRIINAYDIVPFVPPAKGIVSLGLRIISKGKTSKLLKRIEGYTHHGFGQKLTYCDEYAEKGQLVPEGGELERFIAMLIHAWKQKEWDIGVKCHSLEVYREKLAIWGEKRKDVGKRL
ncbi:MAG: lipase family protein [Candidatus Omnitrophota bacterium]